MTPPLVPLVKKALVSALLADIGVSQSVGQRVFDVPPLDRRDGTTLNAKTPFIYVGPISRVRLASGLSPSWTMRLRIYVVTDEAGRDQAWEIIEAVSQRLDLHEMELPADAGRCVQWRLVSDGDIVDPLAPRQSFAEFETILVGGAPYDY